MVVLNEILYGYLRKVITQRDYAQQISDGIEFVVDKIDELMGFKTGLNPRLFKMLLLIYFV